ncbi:MAG: hypothetical protein P0Y59_11325 [Candidatus Sphingomonas phytovorans]|nr:hypothetical protein [Sphingomonas sp.]WEK02238.1 MAG: hypothetical protein P0Y59_11325 [Sphingomonas sp.]
MADYQFKIDRTVEPYEGEGAVILSGVLDAEALRVEVSNEVWALALGHFGIGKNGEPERATPEMLDALERVALFIMKRRGVPQYGMLTLSLG